MDYFDKVLSHMEGRMEAMHAIEHLRANYSGKQVFVVISHDAQGLRTICDFQDIPENLGSVAKPGEWWTFEHRARAAARACYGCLLTNYPTFHLMKDGGVLCQKCLSTHAKEVLSACRGDFADAQWEYTRTDCNYEDTCLYCDHCGRLIPAAYDPEDHESEDDDDTE